MALKKKPWVLLPAGPLGWNSHNYILPELIKVWTDLSAHIELVWFPRPQLSKKWLNQLKARASCIVFPLGLGHYDGLWTLELLREKHGIKIPAIIMVAADLTKGFRAVFDYKEVIYPGFDCFVTNCTAESELVKRALGAAIRVAVIPLPVDLKKKRALASKSRAAYKKSMGLNSDEPLIVYAGRVSLQKNIHSLLIAFSKMRKQVGRGHLIIAGPYDDIGLPHLPVKQKVRYLHALSDLIMRLEIESHVTFSGPLDQEELLLLLAASDVQISLTLHSGEDFGYTIAQGISLGTPTIISKWGGGVDFAENQGAWGIPVQIQKNGPGVDIPEAVKALSTILKKNENSLWRGRAKKCAENYFEINCVAEKWKTLFAEIVHHSSRDQSDGLQPTKLFWKAYQRSKSPRSPKKKLFSSPSDPLYHLISEIYAGGK